MKFRHPIRKPATETNNFLILRFKRVHAKWEKVASWSSMTEEDIRTEGARILAKWMEDANNPVTPKQNAKAVSQFRQKTVNSPDFNCICFNYFDNI